VPCVLLVFGHVPDPLVTSLAENMLTLSMHADPLMVTGPGGHSTRGTRSGCRSVSRWFPPCAWRSRFGRESP